ncbi:type IV pilin [Methanocorpusculum sp.]|nr:type IV pilin [Methanocorpusculum sp.]
MKIMSLKERKEDAVSPVIGVMLMLVVTIVIAAVVAAFAGGIATDTEPTPSVVLTADAYEDKVMLQSLSGDRLEITKLSVNIYEEDGDPLATGTISDTGYFTPGMILKVTFGETKLPVGDNVQIVVTSNDKHTVFNKEVLVKA